MWRVACSIVVEDLYTKSQNSFSPFKSEVLAFGLLVHTCSLVEYLVYLGERGACITSFLSWCDCPQSDFSFVLERSGCVLGLFLGHLNPCVIRHSSPSSKVDIIQEDSSGHKKWTILIWSHRATSSSCMPYGIANPNHIASVTSQDPLSSWMKEDNSNFLTKRELLHSKRTGKIGAR